MGVPESHVRGGVRQRTPRLRLETRRNPYELTTLGEKALRARLASIQAVARVGQKRLASS